MSITFVGSSTSTTATAAIPVGAEAGDLLIAFAFNQGSVTEPSLPASWTNIQNGSGSVVAQRCGWRFWDGSFVGPAWTNATSVLIVAYRGVDATDPVGISAQGGASSADITVATAGTFERTDGTSWGVSLYGHTTQATFAPGFGKERVDFADGVIEQIGALDSAGPVNAWTGGTITHVGSAGNRWVSLELLARPRWNPNYPEVVGLEWMPTREEKSRVWSGTPGRRQRIISHKEETIASLRLSAEVTPQVKESVHTIIDVYEEGDEVTPAFEVAQLIPAADTLTGDWRAQPSGSLTDLFQSIDESATRWPGNSQDTWIENATPFDSYNCSLDVTRFAAAGDLENARIGFVEVRAILGANTGFRKMRANISFDGVTHQPAGGNLRDVHGFGAPYALWYGELNPSTGLPWTPADIADFGASGTTRLEVRTQAATATHFPKVFALRLFVWCVPVENRVAVGLWERPDDLTERLNNVETDALITLPAGTADWAKEDSKNYIFGWRQSVSPSLYGAVVADDVRWNGSAQDFGPGGQPPGAVFPLHTSGTFRAPDSKLASDNVAYDQYGAAQPQNLPDRVSPTSEFSAGGRSAYGIALIDDSANESIDSQPYRWDRAQDLVLVHSGQSVGQRITIPDNQDYLGVRLPIVPPTAESDSILTVSVHRVSDNVQMGGSFQVTADQARALPAGSLPPDVGVTRGGIRFLSGFLTLDASLVAGTAYEIRISSSAATTSSIHAWLAFMPDTSLAPTASFGGSTNGAFIGAAHQTGRDLCVNLIRQPDPPQNVIATIIDVPVATANGSTRDVEHVQITWDAPAVGMGALFSRYDLQRQLDGETTWTNVAFFNDAGLLSFEDHLVDRDRTATYHMRALGRDGRFSDWATSNAVTPVAGDYSVILTSNHRPDLEVVLDVDLQTTYDFLSAARDQTVLLHGDDNQIVFMETEDRGTVWKLGVEVNFGDEPPPEATGDKVFGALLALARAADIPFVCAMDYGGVRVLGHVTPSSGSRSHPGDVYKATLDIFPTHSEEIVVEVDL
jgi:hypothetical protein